MRLRSDNKGKERQESRQVRDPSKIVRRHGLNSTGTMLLLSIEIVGEEVVAREKHKDPWFEDRHDKVGRLFKKVSTHHIKDDKEAARVVEAELERMRGELRDPSLEARQLTDIPFGTFSTTFVIYKPYTHFRKLLPSDYVTYCIS